MELKKRQTIILRSLFDADGVIDSNILQNNLNIAKRTFYYDLEKINDWLIANSMGKVWVSGGKIKTEFHNGRELDVLLKRQKSYFFSVPERRCMIILQIALGSKPAKIGHLMELLDVSKNTVLTAVKEIRSDLLKKGIKLKSGQKDGYILEGDETLIRKEIWTQLLFMDNPECVSLIRNLLQDSLVELTENDIDYYELCRCILKQYERDLQTNCFLHENGYESMMLQVSWIRSLKGCSVCMTEEERQILRETVSYRSVKNNIRKLEIQGIRIVDVEVYYITSVLLGIQTTEFPTIQEENKFIQAWATQFVNAFERIACLHVAEPGRLREQLMQYLRPMFYRMKYGVANKNILTNDIKRMYPTVFEFTRRAATEASSLKTNDLTDDEIATICVYFVGSLGQKYIHKQDEEELNILIVSVESTAPAIFVKNQLQNTFGKYMTFKIITKDQIKKENFDDYAMIVSLVPLAKKYHNDKLVVIESVIDEHMMDRIADIVKEKIIVGKNGNMIEDIISIMCDSMPQDMRNSFSSGRLYFRLFQYFSRQDFPNGDHIRKPHGLPYDDNCIVPLNPEMDWLEAILYGSELFQKECENSRLVERMWNLSRTRMLQFYRINKDVILVHCPMQGENGSRVAVRILLSKKGVRCPDGQEAKGVVCLSTIDMHSHWDTLYDIYNRFNDSDYLLKLLQEAK